MEETFRYRIPITKWVKANILGWAAGLVCIVIITWLVTGLGIHELHEGWGVIGLVFGCSIGLFQWLTLRRILPIHRNWIRDSALGIGIPFLIADAIVYFFKFNSESIYDFIIPIASGGFLAGLLQYKYVKPFSDRPSWWILISITGWLLAVLAFYCISWLEVSVHGQFFQFVVDALIFMIGVILFGLVTGICLNKVLSKQKPKNV